QARFADVRTAEERDLGKAVAREAGRPGRGRDEARVDDLHEAAGSAPASRASASRSERGAEDRDLGRAAAREPGRPGRGRDEARVDDLPEAAGSAPASRASAS